MDITSTALIKARDRYGENTILERVHENEDYVLYTSYKPEYRNTGDFKYICGSGKEMTLANKKTGKVNFPLFFSEEGVLTNYFKIEELEYRKKWGYNDWYNDLRLWGIVEKNLISYIILLTGYTGSIIPSPYPMYKENNFMLAKENFGVFDVEKETTVGTSEDFILRFLKILDKMYIRYEEDNKFIRVFRVVKDLPDMPEPL